MPGPHRDVGDVVRQRARALGPDGEAWLRELPAIVADLERRWSIAVGTPLDGGMEGYVAAATVADGAGAVLKIPLPSKEAIGEVEALRAAGGDGMARLLRHDTESRAMLLERLGPRLAELGQPLDRQSEIICA